MLNLNPNETERTPDGKLKCFQFYRGKCPRGAECRFLHLCLRCDLPHTELQCPFHAKNQAGLQ
jgi:hypothetical protein